MKLNNKSSGYIQKPVDIDNQEVAHEIKDLLPLYICSLRNDISKLKKAYERMDFEGIRFIGHNHKGSGQLYGLDEVSKAGERLEKIALNKNREQITDVISELETLYENICSRSI